VQRAAGGNAACTEGKLQYFQVTITSIGNTNEPVPVGRSFAGNGHVAPDADHRAIGAVGGQLCHHEIRSQTFTDPARIDNGPER
jgi:hypothetical protein